jgi:hypothetical protein
VPLLAKVRDRVAQADYLTRAAQRLGVKEDVLWSEVRGAAARPTGGAGATEAPRPVPAAPPAPLRAEVELIKALLAHPAVAAELRQTLRLEEFESEDCRTVAGTAFALLDRGVGEGFAGRLEFADERLNRIVTGWLADPGLPAGAAEARQTALDCLARLRERRQRRESAALQERIRSAQEAGEDETVRELLGLKQRLCVRAPGKA